MNTDSMEAYAFALSAGDCYAAQLVAILNGVGETTGGDDKADLAVEEPDF
jgi:hypothetical protein